MAKDINDYEKFLALDEEKQERIVNAAMKEFLVGYKKASTDNIVREAGISKGLLFHYFGTKEKLYRFLIDHSMKTVAHEYLDLINITQSDILDSIWQLSLLKQDLSNHYPVIFDFLACAYADETTKGTAIRDSLNTFMKTRDAIFAKVYAQADRSLFRDDIEPTIAINIINWTMQGYAQSIMSSVPSQEVGSLARENYDMFLKQFEQVLNTFRLTFYK